jgi:glycerol-3-phosphate acyltransferase PlsY
VFFLFGALGYLFGSVPFGLIFSHLLGKGDIRKFGSGNIGATNAFRKSRLAGTLTLLFDIGKGALVVYLASKLSEDYRVRIVAGLCAVLGHVFPFWLGFKGGKGVATAMGVFFATNYLVGIFIALTWLSVFIVGKIAGLAALASFAVAPLLTYFLTYDLNLTAVNSAICALIIIRHKQNLRVLVSSVL